MTVKKKGVKIPKFSTVDQNENPVTSEDLIGQKTVIYFYPKDNTPTCTEEACNLRDNYHRFLSEGYKVYGVSPDSAKKHQNFIKKFDLPFDLLVDTDLKLAKAFGVWGEKMLYGRKYMGILRTTFVINEKGKIAEVIEKVKAKEHSEQILPQIPKAH
ncbi:MAG: thioredoxin-dependent thiol peroxidase [Bacteroidetes bacterium]|nr:thioredoxin-dependent thiol peroxidase [Bacteroidota bacterium]